MGREAKFVVRLMASDRRLMKVAITRLLMGKSRCQRVLILLLSDQSEDGPAFTDEQVATMVGVDASTVYRVRKRFVTKGLTAAVDRKRAEPRRSEQPVKPVKRWEDIGDSVFLNTDDIPPKQVPIALLPADLNCPVVALQLWARDWRVFEALRLECVYGDRFGISDPMIEIRQSRPQNFTA